MFIHSRLISVVLCGGCLWLSSAQAHDGTINITGNITDKTCIVSADSKSITVNMGAVSNKQFSRAGDGANYEPFSINLEKCGAAASSVSVTFVGTADAQNDNLLGLDGGEGYATGMGIAIYDDEKAIIPLNQAGEATRLTPNQQTVTLNFYARYVANGATVASGIANAAATFTLTYA